MFGIWSSHELLELVNAPSSCDSTFLCWDLGSFICHPLTVSLALTSKVLWASIMIYLTIKADYQMSMLAQALTL